MTRSASGAPAPRPPEPKPKRARPHPARPPPSAAACSPFAANELVGHDVGPHRDRGRSPSRRRSRAGRRLQATPPSRRHNSAKIAQPDAIGAATAPSTSSTTRTAISDYYRVELAIPAADRHRHRRTNATADRAARRGHHVLITEETASPAHRAAADRLRQPPSCDRPAVLTDSNGTTSLSRSPVQGAPIRRTVPDPAVNGLQLCGRVRPRVR